ncbi:MAG: twin-arginine translocation signal domain-containing protein, partial [Thiocapsa sp.]
MRKPKKTPGAGLDRRDFLKGVASAAATAGIMTAPGVAIATQRSATGLQCNPLGLEAPPMVEGLGEAFWREVRKAFLLPRDYIHMNTGTTGSQPAFSLHNLAVYNRYKVRDPRDWQANLNADFPDLFPYLNGSATSARQQWVAETYGADRDEVFLSYNTTDACSLIFAGTPWRPGDRIITTSFEHPALAGPIAWAR